MICKQCGAPIGEGERICSYCRAAVEMERPVQEPININLNKNSSKRDVNAGVLIDKSAKLCHDTIDLASDIGGIFVDALAGALSKGTEEDIEKAFEEYRSSQAAQNSRNLHNNQKVVQNSSVFYSPTNKPAKDKVSAGILAILLGGIGIHKFYLGKIGPGIAYLFLCWTLIPAIVGVIEGIYYLAVSDEKWIQKVGYKK